MISSTIIFGFIFEILGSNQCELRTRFDRFDVPVLLPGVDSVFCLYCFCWCVLQLARKEWLTDVQRAFGTQFHSVGMFHVKLYYLKSQFVNLKYMYCIYTQQKAVIDNVLILIHEMCPVPSF
jgi:hypothetical protein